MPKNKNSRSVEIALSGICCAAAVIFLIIGIVVSGGWLLGTGYFVGVVALMIPLAKNYYVGDLLAYIATCVLTLILGAVMRFWDMVPFIVFFGIHPLVNALIEKSRFNKWLFLPVKAVWFDGMLIVGYYLVLKGAFGLSFLSEEVNGAINDHVFLIIFTAGSAIGVVYDVLIIKFQQALNAVVNRVIK